MTWPALRGVLSPVCLEVADSMKILHSTSDILSAAHNERHLEITLHGDRDLTGEIVFEESQVDKTKSATIQGDPVTMVRDDKRTVFTYRHPHKDDFILRIRI